LSRKYCKRTIINALNMIMGLGAIFNWSKIPSKKIAWGSFTNYVCEQPLVTYYWERSRKEEKVFAALRECL